MTEQGGRAKGVGTTEPGPWMKWRNKDRAARAIRFISTYCRAPKGYGHGQPLKLAKFQRDWIRAALAEGNTAAVLSVARGNGKSTLLAALAVWALFDPDPQSGAPQVPIVATTVAQAMRSTYDVAVAMILAEDELAERAKIYTAIGATAVQVPATGGRMFPTADKVDSLQGLDPTLALLDEVGFSSVETWQALLLASGKRARSLVVGIGTHGVEPGNALLHLHDLVEAGKQPDGLAYVEYTVPAGCDIHDETQWPLANPAMREGFMNVAAMRTAVAMSTESDVRVYRLNQCRVFGAAGWLGADGHRLWGDLTDPYDLQFGAETWVGIDIGLKRDSTAVVSMQRRPDGRLHARARIWEPTAEEEVDITDVMAYLRALDHDYDVREFPYDPRLFDLPAKQLSDEGLRMVEFPQSAERMAPACGATFEAIVRGELSHDGDKLFATQVLGAALRMNERGFTLAKSKSRGRIDAAIALCLAHDRASRGKPKRAPLLILR